jgi:hypothetical protein
MQARTANAKGRNTRRGTREGKERARNEWRQTAPSVLGSGAEREVDLRGGAFIVLCCKAQWGHNGTK